MKNKLFLILFVFSFISLFFNLYKKDITPPCFTSDEASFAYNSYSILETGKDEYGNFMPLRFKAFGENKLPLYIYLSVPFIKILGLNESSARALNDLVAILIPIAVFFLTKELFKKNSIALIGSFLTATSLGLHLIGRQAHEAYLSALLITVSAIFFIRLLKKMNVSNVLFFIIPLILAMFTYQSSRVFVVYFLLISVVYFLKTLKKHKNSRLVLPFLIGFVLLIFSYIDFNYSSTRINNLFLFTNPGLQVKINELRGEGGSRLLYNKLAVGAREVFFNHLKYFSPQFLSISGDENTRFGYGEMYPITPIEYLFIFVGIYFLIKNKEEWRWLIITLFLITPLSASLTWTAVSLTRSLYILVPASIIAAYGFYSIFNAFPKKRIVIIITIAFIEFIFLLYSWNFYLNHYYKRGVVINSMQCGYKELASYVDKNYDRFDNFYISPERGQPYIFLLFYNKYPPFEYQKQAKLSVPDKYGFGQVEKFDKYIFSLDKSSGKKNVSIVAYPHDFKNLNPKELLKIKKIKILNEEVFWIHEVLN